MYDNDHLLTSKLWLEPGCFLSFFVSVLFSLDNNQARSNLDKLINYSWTHITDLKTLSTENIRFIYESAGVFVPYDGKTKKNWVRDARALTINLQRTWFDLLRLLCSYFFSLSTYACVLVLSFLTLSRCLLSLFFSRMHILFSAPLFFHLPRSLIQCCFVL